jgi:hypothetical protein
VDVVDVLFVRARRIMRIDVCCVLVVENVLAGDMWSVGLTGLLDVQETS